MTSYITREQQEGVVASLRTRQALRNLLRKVRDSEDRVQARIIDKTLVKAIHAFRVDVICQHYGVSVNTVHRYRHKVLFREALPAPEPPSVDWDAVDAEIRTGWHLTELLKTMGPTAIAQKFGVSKYCAEHGGEFMPNSRPAGGHNAMATFSPELREAVASARNEYRATKAKKQRFTYTAIAERHGTSRSSIDLRAKKLRAQEVDGETQH